jgi:hypothetical protein
METKKGSWGKHPPSLEDVACCDGDARHRCVTCPMAVCDSHFGKPSMQAEGRSEFVCQPCQRIGRYGDVEFGLVLESSQTLIGLEKADGFRHPVPSRPTNPTN